MKSEPANFLYGEGLLQKAFLMLVLSLYRLLTYLEHEDQPELVKSKSHITENADL